MSIIDYRKVDNGCVLISIHHFAMTLVICCQQSKVFSVINNSQWSHLPNNTFGTTKPKMKKSKVLDTVIVMSIPKKYH